MADDRVQRRKILSEALEQPEKVHVRIHVEPLRSAETLVAADPLLETARQLAVGERREASRHTLRRADQPPEEVLSLCELRHRWLPECASPPRPRRRAPEIPGCDRRARSASTAARSGARLRRRAARRGR